MSPDWWLVVVAAVPTLLTAAGWAVRRIATMGDAKVALVEKEAAAEKRQAERLAGELKEAHEQIAEERLEKMFLKQKNEILQEDVNQLRAMASAGARAEARADPDERRRDSPGAP